ncbi:MAG: transporter [Bacteroidetes bacterium]|nr:MAG: transporter [Bacteroidota bacterium]
MKIKILSILLLFSNILFAQEEYSLEQCRKLALEHNQKIQIAKEHSGAATALKKSAKTQFLPNFNFNGTYTRLNKQFSLLENDMLLPVIPASAISNGTLNGAALTPPTAEQPNPYFDPDVFASTFVINPATGAPVLDADGNPVFQNYTYIPKDKAKMGSKNMYLMNIGLTQPIFMGGKIKETYKIAKYGENAANATERLKISDILYKTDEAYWRVISVQEKVKLAENYKKMLDTLLIDLQNIYDEGIITNNDLLKAKVKLNEVNLKLLKANNGLTLSKMALCQIIGLPLNSEIALSDSLSDLYQINPDQSYTDIALQTRPEIEILQNSVNIAKSGVNIMKSRYMPNIGLTANYFFANPNPYTGFSEDFGSDWNVGVVCNIPIFHWGDKKHTLRAAKHEQKATELKLEETQELISLQVKQAVFKSNESVTKVQMTKISLEQAKKNLDDTKNKFKEGILKTTDVLDAQALWQNAYSEYIDAVTENKLNQTNLLKVTGQLKNIKY